MLPLDKKLELDRLIEHQQNQRIAAQRRIIERHVAARKRRIRRRVALAAAIAIALFALIKIGLSIPAKADEEVLAAATVAAAPEEDPDEDEQIEAALMAQGYYRNDIPLTYQEQDYLHTACEEFGVDYDLALAVIHQETGFRNIIGDDGKSAGYMQIQARWHTERMDKLGVTDLMDPYSNFRVGCSFLSGLLTRYGNTEDALTAYNSGQPGESDYADDIINYMKGMITP